MPVVQRSFYNKQSISSMANNSGGQRVQIFIRLNNGNGCELVIEKRQTLDQLIDALNSHQDIELPAAYRILYRGRHIHDLSKSVAELGICDKAILHVEEVEQRVGRSIRMDVCIFWNNEKYIVKSESRENILKLKQSIQRLLRVPPRDQLLVFKGFILQNDQTLQHYRITPDSLICMHSNAKMFDEDDVHSDYEQADEGFKLKDTGLLESVLSLGEKKSGATRSSLFRSDSMGMKNVEEATPYEIQIHHKVVNDDNQSQSQKEFNFDLFKSFGMSNPMTISIGYNLFDSLKHPVDRFTFKTYEIKSQDEQQIEEQDELCCDNNLAQSVTSFENV